MLEFEISPPLKHKQLLCSSSIQIANHKIIIRDANMLVAATLAVFVNHAVRCHAEFVIPGGFTIGMHCLGAGLGGILILVVWQPFISISS